MDVPEKLNLCRRGEVIYLNKWGKCKVVSFRPDEQEQEEPERKGTSLLYMLVVLCSSTTIWTYMDHVDCCMYTNLYFLYFLYFYLMFWIQWQDLTFVSILGTFEQRAAIEAYKVKEQLALEEAAALEEKAEQEQNDPDFLFRWLCQFCGRKNGRHDAR